VTTLRQVYSVTLGLPQNYNKVTISLNKLLLNKPNEINPTE